jgi:hypothetical protein
MKKKKILITITRELELLLLNEKRETGASVAEIIRRAIFKYFEK